MGLKNQLTKSLIVDTNRETFLSIARFVLNKILYDHLPIPFRPPLSDSPSVTLWTDAQSILRRPKRPSIVCSL